MATATEERWQTRIKSISDGVRHIYASKDFTDVTFWVRGESFRAHKLILASRSPEFARLLMSPNASDEFIVDRASPVTVTGFKMLLEFIYTNELNVTDKKAIAEAYLAATYYKQRVLQTRYKQEIESWVINADEVCDFLDLYWDLPDLREKCISFIRNNGIGVISSDSFAKASFNSVTAIINSGALTDVPVVQRIEYIMKWGRNHCGLAADDYSLVRKKLMDAQPPLLAKLGFQNLNLQEISKTIKTYPNLLTSEEITKFVIYCSTKDNSDLPGWCTVSE